MTRRFQPTRAVVSVLRRAPLVIGAIAFTAVPCGSSPRDTARAEDDATYELRYAFSEGEILRTKVTHMATTETTIRGVTQESKSRSHSTKIWKVLSIDDQGAYHIEHEVENVDMWQKLSDRPEVTFNSGTDKKAPPEYELAADSIGVPITRVTVDPYGEVKEREDLKASPNMGLGQITTPLPKGKVAVGHQWEFPTEIAVQMPDGRVRRIKTRQLYTLESVKTGVATISVRTQILTPVNDPKIEVQIVQQITNGQIKFDIDAGRVLSKQVDWDESVVGFNGSESRFKYLARFTEEYVPRQPKVAGRPAP
ncbi:MAG: hypothetical protein FJ297_01125 [Planctomycetes bacterium]|nr:hypothetical protein [Planctomycetota bacterium]